MKIKLAKDLLGQTGKFRVHWGRTVYSKIGDYITPRGKVKLTGNRVSYFEKARYVDQNTAIEIL